MNNSTDRVTRIKAGLDGLQQRQITEAEMEITVIISDLGWAVKRIEQLQVEIVKLRKRIDFASEQRG